MKTLAIETVGTTGSVAALAAGRVLAERQLERTRRSAQTLAPTIGQLLDQLGWKPADVQLVAVATGPGSFTGLRIGVTTAKAFAYGVGCPIVGVNSLLAIASQVPAEAQRFAAVIDAQRGELFAADFERSGDGNLNGERTTRITAGEAWLNGLPPGSVVTGPGLANFVARLPAGAIATDPSCWAPTAGSVGRLGWQSFSAGPQSEDVFSLVPHYFRLTAAEEQWHRKQSS